MVLVMGQSEGIRQGGEYAPLGVEGVGTWQAVRAPLHILGTVGFNFRAQKLGEEEEKEMVRGTYTHRALGTHPLGAGARAIQGRNVCILLFESL